MAEGLISLDLPFRSNVVSKILLVTFSLLSGNRDLLFGDGLVVVVVGGEDNCASDSVGVAIIANSHCDPLISAVSAVLKVHKNHNPRKVREEKPTVHQYMGISQVLLVAVALLMKCC